jgi:transposase
VKQRNDQRCITRQAMLASPRGRFVAAKSEETQGAAAVFRVRELLIRQRTQTINALRGHLAEFGEVVTQGISNARRLIALVEAEGAVLPKTMRAALSVLVTKQALYLRNG